MSADPFDGLRIAQSSTAERVSDAIRDLIVQGELLGGQPLREHSLREALGVSRNTVREALRLLSRERLVVYHLHKGVAVRQISAEDVREIFRTREPIEVIAIEYSRQAPPEALKALLKPVEVAEAAARGGDWKAVATENLHFHQQVVDLVGIGADQRVLPQPGRRAAAGVRPGRARGGVLLPVPAAQPAAGRADRRRAGRRGLRRDALLPGRGPAADRRGRRRAGAVAPAGWRPA